jgi:copper resistance protein C
MNRRTIAGLILVLLLALGRMSVALAHAELVSSDPTAGARLTSAPAKITLVFDEELDSAESTFTVANAQGAVVGEGKLDTNDLDHKTLTGTLRAGTGDGVYTVSWEVLTPDDGAHTEGAFTFGVNADPGAQPTAAAHDDEEATATPATASTAQPTTASTTRPTTAAAQPTSAAQPTAVAGGAPAALPQTGDGDMPIGGYLLLAAALVLGMGLALRRRTAGR